MIYRGSLSFFTTNLKTHRINLRSNLYTQAERCIHLPTRDPFMMVVVSYKELILTLDLLEHTMMLIEIEQLLE